MGLGSVCCANIATEYKKGVQNQLSHVSPNGVDFRQICFLKGLN